MAAEREPDFAERGRRAVRDITATLAAAIVALAMVLVLILASGEDAALAVGGVALAVVLAAAVPVVLRGRAVAAERTRLIETERLGREQMERTLAAIRPLVDSDSPIELRRRICEVARHVFECSAVSLWDVEPDHMRLLERVPWVHPYTQGERRPIDELPGLREAFAASEPLFVANLQDAATGVTRATAEITGSGSLLNVPVGYGGVTRMSLVLIWDRVLPAVTVAQRITAQRFADQAGLAIEQVRNRTAQAEIASLNRTLQRMVQADPLFRAGGTVAEVAAAICTEALGIFEADAAALWLDAGDGIELVHRVPAARILPVRGKILYREHPSFEEDLTGGLPRFVADVEHEDPVLWERFARHSDSRSQLRLPLAGGGGQALLVLSWSAPIPPPSAELSALASRFGDQAGIAMAEAARREARLEAGALHARFEQSLLPSIGLAGAGADVATFYRPGDARLSLGGDFYDCLQREDGTIALLIGDVAGHGAAAAALGAGLRSAWRALVLGGWALEDQPGGLQAVCVSERHDPYLFVTAITAVLDPARGKLRFVSAGHPAPLLLGAPAIDTENGPPLGIVEDPSWHAVEVDLPEVATVVLYTDGLVEGREAPGSPERLGIEPISAQLGHARPGAVSKADLEALVALATRANGDGLPDDVALLAVNLKHPAG